MATSSGALVEKRASSGLSLRRDGAVRRPGPQAPAARHQPFTGVLEPRVETIVDQLPDAVFDQLPTENGSRRRVVTKTTTERFAIEDDVRRPRVASVNVDREGLIARCLRLFFAVLAGIFAVLLASAAAGMMVEGYFIGAFILVAIACGLGIVARECWAYEHG